MQNDVRAAALAFLDAHQLGALATVSAEGTARVRFLYYAHDISFNIYFLTYVNTRKVADLAQHREVAFAVADEEAPRSVQIEGTVADVTNTEVPDTVITELFAHVNSNKEYGAPLTHLDNADLRFYKLTPTWVRFGDFTAGGSTDAVLHEIAP